jgi:hypothetical protein
MTHTDATPTFRLLTHDERSHAGPQRSEHLEGNDHGRAISLIHLSTTRDADRAPRHFHPYRAGIEIWRGSPTMVHHVGAGTRGRSGLRRRAARRPRLRPDPRRTGRRLCRVGLPTFQLALSGVMDRRIVNIADDAALTIYELAQLVDQPYPASAEPVVNPWRGHIDVSLARSRGFQRDIRTVHQAVSEDLM